MAQPQRRRAENVAGPLFVDDTCIDCDTCRWMAPSIFADIGDQSAVVKQPETDDERLAAYQALLSCPTASIGTTEKGPLVAAARETFPLPITPDVLHCGYHSEDSFGATSYLILRLEGNVLVDSPRYVPHLVKGIEALGGVRYMFLTHRDDVAEHEKYAQHFGCERILHVDDVTSDTRAVEIQPEGDARLDIAPDLVVLPTPGHTRGHSVLLHRDTHLFTGDHLAWSPRREHLIAFRDACWYSWPKQVESMKRLRDLRFSWVLPGHGRRIHLEPAAMRDSLDRCIEWMENPRG